MGRKPIGKANQFSSAVNAELRAEIARQRISLRRLEEKTNISKSRIGSTINQDEAPINTNELDLLCKVLGVSASEVLRQAERAIEQTNYALAAKHRQPLAPGQEEGVEYYE